MSESEEQQPTGCRAADAPLETAVEVDAPQFPGMDKWRMSLDSRIMISGGVQCVGAFAYPVGQDGEGYPWMLPVILAADEVVWMGDPIEPSDGPMSAGVGAAIARKHLAQMLRSVLTKGDAN